VSDVQVQPLAEVEVAAARESARRPAVVSVPSALQAGEAAEVAAPLALQPAVAEHAAAEAVVPRVEVAPVAALRGEVAAAEAGVPPASEAAGEEEPQAVREPQAAARPSAVAPSSRLRLAPARRSAVTMRFAPAPRRLRIASQ
jgi:hypothetical protein